MKEIISKYCNIMLSNYIVKEYVVNIARGENDEWYRTLSGLLAIDVVEMSSKKKCNLKVGIKLAFYCLYN